MPRFTAVAADVWLLASFSLQMEGVVLGRFHRVVVRGDTATEIVARFRRGRSELISKNGAVDASLVTWDKASECKRQIDLGLSQPLPTEAVGERNIQGRPGSHACFRREMEIFTHEEI